MRFITVVAAAIILVFGLASAAVAGDPIHTAAHEGDLAKVKSLLASGARVDARDENGFTPLHWAKTAQIAKVLLKAGARVDARGKYGETPLNFGLKTVEVTKVLLKAGAKVDARDGDGFTSLHWAAFFASADVVEVLLKAGANPKAKNIYGQTPFALAKSLPFVKGTEAYWLLNEAQYD